MTTIEENIKKLRDRNPASSINAWELHMDTLSMLVAELRRTQSQIGALVSRLPQPRCEFGMELPNNGGYYRCELPAGHEGQHKSWERV